MKNNRKSRKKWGLKARKCFGSLVSSNDIKKFTLSRWRFDSWPWDSDESGKIIYKKLPIMSVKCWRPDGKIIELEYMPFLPEGYE
jgi:hypothetical protein